MWLDVFQLGPIGYNISQLPGKNAADYLPAQKAKNDIILFLVQLWSACILARSWTVNAL